MSAPPNIRHSDTVSGLRVERSPNRAKRPSRANPTRIHPFDAGFGLPSRPPQANPTTTHPLAAGFAFDFGFAADALEAGLSPGLLHGTQRSGTRGFDLPSGPSSPDLDRRRHLSSKGKRSPQELRRRFGESSP